MAQERPPAVPDWNPADLEPRPGLGPLDAADARRADDVHLQAAVEQLEHVAAEDDVFGERVLADHQDAAIRAAALRLCRSFTRVRKRRGASLQAHQQLVQSAPALLAQVDGQFLALAGQLRLLPKRLPERL